MSICFITSASGDKSSRMEVLVQGFGRRRQDRLGSILQNSISAENFSDKFFVLKFRTNFHQKTTTDINLPEKYGQ
jgi:hypothetical protein